MRMRRVAKLVAALLVVSSAAVIFLTVNGKQVSNVFMNISSGLNTGTGVGIGGDSLSTDSGGTGTNLQAMAPQPGKAAAVQDASAPGGNDGTLSLGRPPGQVERTVEATYQVPHDKFEQSFKDVISRAVDREGGFVVNSTTEPDASGRMVSGTLVMKVPADKLSDFLDSLPSGTFKPSSINFSTIDHTAQYIDTKARLDQAQQELNALERALAATSDPATISNLTQQISDAQANLEKQQAAFAVVQQLVDLATVTVHLKESGATAVAPPPSKPIFVSSAQGGWNNDIAIASGMVYIVLTALPFLLLLVIVGLQRRRLVRWAKALLM